MIRRKKMVFDKLAGIVLYSIIAKHIQDNNILIISQKTSFIATVVHADLPYLKVVTLPISRLSV